MRGDDEVVLDGGFENRVMARGPDRLVVAAEFGIDADETRIRADAPNFCRSIRGIAMVDHDFGFDAGTSGEHFMDKEVVVCRGSRRHHRLMEHALRARESGRDNYRVDRYLVDDAQDIGGGPGAALRFLTRALETDRVFRRIIAAGEREVR